MVQQFHNSTFIFPENAQEDLDRLENGAGGEADERTVKAAPYLYTSSTEHRNGTKWVRCET